MKQKSYAHFKDTELFLPNQMSYTELAFESVISGEDNGLADELSSYLDIRTKHRDICERLRLGLEVETHDHSEDFYRTYGHLQVNLGLFKDRRIVPSELMSGSEKMRSIYCNDIGYEFMHTAWEEQAWFIDLLEGSEIDIPKEWLVEAYEDVVRADRLERFLGIQFVGQKRFSLEGCESLIPLLERIIKTHVEYGYDDVVIGMPHRGRVNTLVNVLGISVEALVNKFSGNKVGEHSGDVKYHLGHSVDRSYKDKPYHIALAYNPSHLEAINSVVCGSVRAKIDRKETKPFGILMHGDSAIAGQGVVMETLAMSLVPAYHVGGTVHVVVNNQIGFTTEEEDARSSTYCTDIAKMIGAPVLHVYADKVESVIKAAVIVSKYHKTFQKDVFIDLVGFRKYGHNEADEPSSTLPLMYKEVKKKKPVASIYREYLLSIGVLEETLVAVEDKIQELIKKRGSLIEYDKEAKSSRHKDWVSIDQMAWDAKYKVPVTKKLLDVSMKQLIDIPIDFNLQKQVSNVIKARIEMAKGELPLNWGMAELAAYQVLLNLGHTVRLVGQDVIRGTFSHRMASVYDQVTGKRYELVKGNDKASFYNYNSILSEYAALGFEYGYAEARPNDLVVFEAQFGDFINGAQIIIDQFISSAYQKWQRYCHLVMLLPHGYEGQGPEHSSARIERFLQLCAEDNIQVCIPSTPAQIYHLLVRQVMRNYRRPLIVFTPKSLLRHPKATSNKESLLDGRYLDCIDDPEYQKAKRIILCSGKVYYDLLEYREDRKVAIIRIEQLHPFPHRTISRILKAYSQLKEVVWTQEEPLNQGAWLFLRDRLENCLPKSVKLGVVSRKEASSPAVGYPKEHKAQQEELVKQAFEEKI